MIDTKPFHSLGLTRRRALMLGAGALGAGAFGAASTFGLRDAEAQVRLQITEGNFQPMPIAIPDFFGGNADAEVARNVSAIVTNNLRRSGLFAPIDPAAFIQKLPSAEAAPNFPDWRALKSKDGPC